MVSSNNQSVLNKEYIKILVTDYLLDENINKAEFITQRIISEFEVAIFTKIRETCYKFNSEE